MQLGGAQVFARKRGLLISVQKAAGNQSRGSRSNTGTSVVGRGEQGVGGGGWIRDNQRLI